MTASPPIRTLRRYLPGKAVERCELCGAALPGTHAHLLDLEKRRLSCACEPCSILFTHRGGSSLRRVGRRLRRLPDVVLTEAEWEALRIPIGLAFFVNSSPQGRVMAFYPGPAGTTESLLPLEAWSAIAARNPMLRQMEPDVEALLAYRVNGRTQHYLVPIDRCYELVGLFRLHWRGLSGGEEVWREVDAFFTRIEEAQSA